MGRPSKKNPKKQYTVMLEPEIIERIDIKAEQASISRSNLMKQLILRGLDSEKNIIDIPDDVSDRIDIIAEKTGLTRSNLMKNLLLLGLDAAKIYESIGVLSAVGMGRKVIDWFKKSKNEGKIIFDNEGEFKIVDTE